MATKKLKRKTKKKTQKLATAKQPRIYAKKAFPEKPAKAPEFALTATTAADPLGACIWYDNTGQPHCTTTTQSLCKAKPGTFYPGQACPGFS